MADKEVTSKLILQGDPNGLVAAMEKAKASATGMVGHMNSQSKELTHSFEGVHAVLGRIGTFMVALAAGAGLKKILDEAADWNLSAGKMAKTMGTTSEEASVLQVALHGLGIENGVAESAALKLSLTLSKGTDKFDKFGITVKDSHGALLPMPQIMANVNEKLLATQTGADRNIMAISLYGKAWKELSAILKVTPEALEEARETAERLHLVVGPKGIEQSLQYKKNIREVGLVAESLAIQLGNELMPAVISVSSALAHNGVNGASLFGSAIKESIRVVQESGVVFGATIDKIAAWQQTGGLLYHTPAQMAEYKRQTAIIDEAAGAQMAAINRAMDEGPKKSKAPAGDKLNIDTLNASRASDRASAGGKYLEYEKAFEERRAGIVKIANDAALETNRLNYEHGLVDLKAFLDKKDALSESSLAAEVTARTNELAAAQKAMKLAETSEVKDKKGHRDTDKETANIYEAWKKEEQAQKALAEAESKFHLLRMKNSDEYRKALDGELIGKNAMAAHWREVYAKNEEDERKAELNHQNGLVAMAAAAAEQKLSFLGQDEAALQLHYDSERQQIVEQTQWKLDNLIMEESEKRRLNEETSARLLQLDQQTAVQRAQLWWNNSQQYIGFAQNMSTMAVSLLFAEEGQKNQIGKRMLATSVRFIAQGLQQFMFGKAKEHLLAAAAAAGQIQTRTGQVATEMGIGATAATAWAAFYSAMSLNPYGGQAFIPAALATAASAVGFGAAAGAAAAEGTAGMGAELGMAAAWAAGGIAVGAMGEAGAGAIEGGRGGSTSSGGYSAGGSYGGPSNGLVTQPINQATQATPQYTVTIYGAIGERRWFEENLPGIMRDMGSRNVNLGVVYS